MSDIRYIKPLVFGGIDGLTTTLALVWGTIAVGEERVSSTAAIVLGTANLLATGLSMGIGDYIGTIAEHEAKVKEDGVEVAAAHAAVRAIALRSGLTMFVSFIVFGCVPLMAYLPLFGSVGTRRVVSTLLCFMSFFGLGYVRGAVSGVSKVKSSLMMLLLGSGAAFVSFSASKIIFWIMVGDG